MILKTEVGKDIYKDDFQVHMQICTHTHYANIHRYAKHHTDRVFTLLSMSQHVLVSRFFVKEVSILTEVLSKISYETWVPLNH